MKRLMALSLIALLVCSCSSYETVSRIGKNTVAVTKNDNFLFGITRGPQVWLCQVTPTGLKGCVTGENP
ncbi:MAG: hypothetical protein A2X86_18025 [Bdellovibrionales bacterium GWA2_49_15]|nr:MAG: hypothetical protein A2X86_18025 [Bdellovibrionales bacterium GWA2_49_15]HAZ11623.1 hypothetical protein [Bdellovibrionales bacterium]